MRANDFQKNGLLKINSVANSKYNKFARRSLEEIKSEMHTAKRNWDFNKNKEEKKVLPGEYSKCTDFRKKVDNIRNISNS